MSPKHDMMEIDSTRTERLHFYPASGRFGMRPVEVKEEKTTTPLESPK